MATDTDARPSIAELRRLDHEVVTVESYVRPPDMAGLMALRNAVPALVTALRKVRP